MHFRNRHLERLGSRAGSDTGIPEGILFIPVFDFMQAIRKAIRNKRAALPRNYQTKCAHTAARHFRISTLFHNSQHIACYWSSNGELDPRPLVETAWRLGKRVYLPVLDPIRPGHLKFVAYTPKSKFKTNRFGIPEPDAPLHQARPVKTINLIITPLVAFNESGVRLGMGGGFYDRTFAFLQKNHCAIKLIGYAYSWQKVEDLMARPWDIHMDGVATEKGFKLFKPSSEKEGEI